MTLDAQGYYTATINTKGKAIDFVFHDKDTYGWEVRRTAAMTMPTSASPTLA